MVVRWNKYALQDLEKYAKYSKKSNISEYIESLVKNINNLKYSPRLGHIYTYSKQYIIRKYVYKEHTVLYCIDKDTIHILVVINHKQDINKKLKFIKSIIEKDII